MLLYLRLKEMLEKNGISPVSTPYTEVCGYPIRIRDFLSVEPIWDHRNNFAVFAGYEKELLDKTRTLREKLAGIDDKIRRIRTAGGDACELQSARAEKKTLLSAIESQTREFYAFKPEKYVISYQNLLLANTFGNITELVPPMGGIKSERLYQMPLFTRNITDLQHADLSEAGVVGGPCLFGTDEMTVRITHLSGEEFCFDFNTGVNCNADTGCDLSEHIMASGDQISDVSFDNNKTRMTIQEYESLAYPMEMAAVLNASFIFPIPDMSYRKFLESITKNLRRDVLSEMIEKFIIETRKIADLHIGLFESLLKKFKPKRYLLLHESDSETLNYFYAEREKYFNGSRFLRKDTGFSGKPGRNGAVYDYVSLLAAPFYFWGTKNIIQIDPIDETSSMEKCARVHKKEFKLTGIMYPEIISKNGIDTIFYAQREDKIYC